MAAIDPSLAGAIAGEAIDREIALLATNARALRAQLQDGAVVTARVLRSNGLTDMVEILGRRVAAALPPDLHPGDVISVMVKAFDGTRLVLQRLAAEPETAQNGADEGATAKSGAEKPATPPAAAPAALSRLSQRPAETTDRPSQKPAPGFARAPETGGLDAAEARVAAARAASGSARSAVRPGTARPQPAPGPGTASPAPRPGTAAPAPAAPRTQATAPAPPGRPAAAPSPAAPSTAPARSLPSGAASPPVRTGTFVAPPVVTSAAAGPPGQPAVAPRVLDASALLAALRIELPPERLATVRTALRRPDRLPEVLRAFDAVLAEHGSEHSESLRAQLGFIERLDPHAPTLAVQIASFVSHIVDGREPKLASYAAAAGQGDEHEKAAAQLRVENDLGTRIFGLLTDSRAASTPEVRTLAAATFAAGTAAHTETSAALARDPGAVTFAIPMACAGGTRRAEIRIGRKDGDPRAPIDPSDVHIGFVLSTEALGTVNVDLHTVERSVRVRVIADDPTTVERFSGTLGDLEARLEALRYRVAALDAGLRPDPHPARAADEPAADGMLTQPPSGRLDLQI